jgi:hypothetical protein
VAESILIANAFSQAAFQVSLMQFFTEKSGSGGSFHLNIREVIDGLTGGGAGIYGPTASKVGVDATVGGVVVHNLKKNWMPLLAQMIGIPLGFKVAKKFLRRPVLNPANRLLRSAGISEVKL